MEFYRLMIEPPMLFEIELFLIVMVELVANDNTTPSTPLF